GGWVGLYGSTNGGVSFAPAFLPTPQDLVVPSSPNGGDFFRGGASHVALYRTSAETQVYASFFDYGIYRRSATLDGDASFRQVFSSAGGGTVAGSPCLRAGFSLPPERSR